MHAIALATQDLTGVLGRPSQHDLPAARQMEAMSFAFHIPLVCFGIAFPAMVLFVEGLWLRTGDATYRDLARRWSKALVVLFAVGVVTGTILSFELGLLWPNFMATFGSVVGRAFAMEGFAFFTEAIFIAMYVYSWDRVGPRVQFAMGVPIALAGIVGSLMVIAVNGWMNHPTGFTVSGAGVSDVHPWAALFNSHLPYELVHMYLAGYMVAGFIVAAVYARATLRGWADRYVRAALVVPLTAAALAAPAQVVVGDWAGRMVARDQTVKLAAMEGIGRTQADAPLHIGGIYENGAMHASIEIPGLLSLLAYHDIHARVAGLDTVAPANRPPVNVVHLAFDAMVGIGTLLALLGIGWFVLAARRRLPRSPWFYRAVDRGRAAVAHRPARGMSSVLTPFFLGAAIGAVASGSVPLSGAGAPFSAWVHPLPLLAGALALVTGTHLAAVYMAGDAAHLGLDDLRRRFRARALVTGSVAGALAIGGLAVVHGDAPALYHGLTTGAGLACVVVSAVAGVAALALVAGGRYDAAPSAPRSPSPGSPSAGASPSIRRCSPAA